MPGIHVLRDPLANRGTGFSLAERERLGLAGLLPMRLFLFLSGLALAAGLTAAEAPTGELPASTPAPETARAELYIFNDSGRTLIASDQIVTDNGRRLASLPRQTYAKFEVSPGPHLLKPDPPLWKQQVFLEVAADKRYFVVIAYRPERSWAIPVAGAPLVLREISEEEASPLLREMKPARPQTPEIDR